MATEEVNKPGSLPPYHEWILAAIDELNEEGGSNKSAISHYIEINYSDHIPENHSQLLSDHLNEMKESGEIMFHKNSYMRFNPEAPPKRGRGRPRKDPNAPPAPKKTKTDVSTSVGSGRPRGRPPKKTNGGESEGEKEKSVRPRGRPPKNKPHQAAVGVHDG